MYNADILCHFHKNDKYIQSSWKTKGISHLNDHTSLVAQMVKDLPAMWETWVRPFAWEDPREKGMATLQYSRLVSSRNKKTWQTTVPGVAHSQTQPSDWQHTAAVILHLQIPPKGNILDVGDISCTKKCEGGKMLILRYIWSWKLRKCPKTANDQINWKVSILWTS